MFSTEPHSQSSTGNLFFILFLIIKFSIYGWKWLAMTIFETSIYSHVWNPQFTFQILLLRGAPHIQHMLSITHNNECCNASENIAEIQKKRRICAWMYNLASIISKPLSLHWLHHTNSPQCTPRTNNSNSPCASLLFFLAYFIQWNILSAGRSSTPVHNNMPIIASKQANDC